MRQSLGIAWKVQNVTFFFLIRQDLYKCDLTPYYVVCFIFLSNHPKTVSKTEDKLRL